MTLPLSFVEANGVRFAYLEQGAGPLVLMVHGFPDTARSWSASAPAVAAAGFRVVCPFTRGYHPTAVPADGHYETETLGRDVLALIDALGDKTAILVGHDWGAAAVYAAAQLDPAKVRFLVTVGIPHPNAVRPLPRVVWGARHFIRFKLPGAVNLLRANDFAYVDRLVKRWGPTWRFEPEETRPVKESFSNPGSAEAAVGYYRAWTPRRSAVLKRRISVPTVSFAGADDPVLAPADYEYARRFFASTYRVVTMPGGHFMHREHPGPFNEELLRALGEAPPAIGHPGRAH